METVNTILEYRRSTPAWVCPNCDTENDLSNSQCLMCGRVRSNDEWVIPAWTPPVESVPVQPANNFGSNSGMGDVPYNREVPMPVYIDSDTRLPEKPDDKNGVLVWLIVGATVLFMILVAMIVLNMR